MTPRHSPTLIGLCLACLPAMLALGGCDDAGETRKDTTAGTPGQVAPGDQKGDQKGAPTETALPQKFKNPAEAIVAYNKCYSDCFGARVSATNRETCKLDCDALAETGMDTITDAAAKTTYQQTWQSLRGCITQCFEDKSLNATNRQTCLLTCSDEAEVEAITKSAAPAGTATPPTGAGTPTAGTPTKVVTPPGTTPPATAPTKGGTPSTTPPGPAKVTPTPAPTPAAPAKK